MSGASIPSGRQADQAAWIAQDLRDLANSIDPPAKVGARPLLFIRARLMRGGMAEFIAGILREEQAALLEDLGAARARHEPENGPLVSDLRQKLVWLINVLRDIDSGMIEIAGPDIDPREER